jgi:hypothetical protein
LIEAGRTGANLFPRHAWRLFVDEFDLSGMSPREALVAFATKFGIDLKVGSEIHKIVFRRDVKLNKGKPTRLVDSDAILVEITSDEEQSQVGLTYAIDNERYVNYLERHGIREDHH